MVKKKEVNFLSLLKTKRVTKSFDITSLILGFLFTWKGTITGKEIFNSGYSLNPFLVMGLLLISCSIILGAYSLKKE